MEKEEKGNISSLIAPIGKTLPFMLRRELLRSTKGHYKRNIFSKAWFILVIGIFATIVAKVLIDVIEFDQTKNPGLNVLVQIIIIGLGYLMFMFSLEIRWFLYWILLTTFILLLLDRSVKDKDAKENAQLWTIAAFITLESATLFIRFWDSYIFPQLIYNQNKIEPHQMWDIQPERDTVGFYTIRRFMKFGNRRAFSYLGNLNSHNQPHGYGKWTSEWAKGEVLSGYWENGYPIGPFKSREYKSGYSFSNIRIGFVATDSAGFKSQSLKRHPKFRYGVASIECSTSGRFFSGLPKVRLVYDPYCINDSDLETSLEKIVHISDFTEARDVLVAERIMIDYHPTKGFTINGYTPIDRTARHLINISCSVAHDNSFSGSTSPNIFAANSLRNSKNAIALKNQNIEPDLPSLNTFDISGWEKQSTQTEILLYIPGFNCSIHDAIEAVGQMLTLGAFPARIKPIIFGWPCGSLVLYSKAKVLAKSDQTSCDLIKVIRELITIGITKIHLLSHSMGARVVSNASKDFSKVFHLENQCSESSDNLSGLNYAELASVIYLNPEYPLEKFKTTTFQHLRNFTSLISMYGSHNDIALLSAEYISGKKILGRNPSLLQDENDEILDMDIIDTSELDMNVHAARHSYFNLNKYIIDDVADIISNGQRARQRENSLVLMKGNVYGFLTAPSFIKN
jgi:esterase/lipase superfamily enzyme/uncharacterized membrane protein